MTELQIGDRVQWMALPGYECGIVRAFTDSGVYVDLENGTSVHVGANNVRDSLRRISVGPAIWPETNWREP